MVTCPACGKENAESAYECKRCRAPLREESPASGARAGDSLGEVCRRCEAYNGPGVRVCTNCGLPLSAGDAAGAAPMDKTPPDAFTPPSQVPETLSEELRALAISDEEAAEAGLTLPRSGPSLDKTPPDPFAVPPGAPAGRAQAGSLAAGAAAPTGRRPPPAPPPPGAGKGVQSPAIALPAQKPCGNCGALNPPAAKFCFDCGTPFAKKPAPAVAAPPSIQVDAALGAEVYEDATMESSRVSAREAEAPADDAPVPAESVAEPIPEEEPPPFPARLVQESGPAQGSEFVLAHLENSIGGSAAHIGFGDDAFVAPHAATLAFVDERLVLRDEGSANGVYLRLREPTALQPGDLFVTGERLLRYDGPVEMPRGVDADPPFLGAPRPQGSVARVTEVLAGARTGRTCHRSGPSITIGRAGCDLNFPADALLAARHAEVRLGEDGSATLADVAEGGTGVFLRVRPQQPVELQAGDVLRVGQQQLRLEI
jgi:pSer/pThr/pTyr-binding forkhead associated (FHA) protein/ribosomal protein L40E